MNKIEPAHHQFRRNHNGDVSRWMTAPDPHLIKEFGYEVRQLYTDEALQTVAEAVYEAVLKAAYASEGEVLLEKPIDISAIINQLKGHIPSESAT